MALAAAFDPRSFIRARLPLVPAPGIPRLRLHLAGAASGLSRFLREAESPRTPYWAYLWAGGAALARYILEHPETVAGRRVVDVGAGSGVVAIAAALAGAREVTAIDVDPLAVAAVELNAAANGALVTPRLADAASEAPPAADLVVVGDLFYERGTAERVGDFLLRCAGAGADVLVGDPGRAFLPRARLRQLALYAVTDFGDGAASTASIVFALDRS